MTQRRTPYATRRRPRSGTSSDCRAAADDPRDRDHREQFTTSLRVDEQHPLGGAATVARPRRRGRPRRSSRRHAHVASPALRAVIGSVARRCGRRRRGPRAVILTAPADDAVVTVTVARPNRRSSGPRSVSTVWMRVIGAMRRPDEPAGAGVDRVVADLQRCTRYRHRGTTTMSATATASVTANTVTCGHVVQRPSSTAHTTCAANTGSQTRVAVWPTARGPSCSVAMPGRPWSPYAGNGSGRKERSRPHPARAGTMRPMVEVAARACGACREGRWS